MFHDAIANDENPHDIGKRVILPSSHIGSPRHMHEYSQDAMCYVTKHGRPDLFVTFTCNQHWPEIKEQLYKDQPAYERHDIIARVFQRKLERLIELIKTNQLFGEVVCYLYTIEWQKRGLPHAHILIWFKVKIQPNQVDSIISAELPDPNLDPLLSKIVLSCMIHTPCSDNLGLDCMKNERLQCSKKFPRQLISETKHGEDGYPTYRRRSVANGGFEAEIKRKNKTYKVDNSWVVPYNPVLLRIFDAHINVEYCHSVKSIK